MLQFPTDEMPNEVNFAPDPGGTGEDDGWMFTNLSILATQRSQVWIIDAKSIQSKPTAVIEIPAWIPAGVHGSWIPVIDVVYSENSLV